MLMIEFKKGEFYTTCTGFDSFTDDRLDYGNIRACGSFVRFFPATGIAYTLDDLKLIGKRIALVNKLGELGGNFSPKSKK